ncbi:L-histidine N(alpha)-methyltransferase [Paraburkholderia sp. MMS20-SJTN17]|uniref:L-histidine N(Alpha)-methyltransferase n=1 Tax=Paraburkholderia translucens TaxID=2886945 RepID=A0ABS8KIQ1_9BURK|nr:L-histidine N(alpha)-methyltransferase [Paraburkholderia sp. MMS20-SJTN17]MCC8404643.1 L-histidine N(alpha)-methyltransferase [Paraburkholderia sp. MMS20-SJTN17]
MPIRSPHESFSVFPLISRPTTGLAAFGAEADDCLTHAPQTWLPSKHPYHETGSALFEVVTTLPESAVTRAEKPLLTRYVTEVVDVPRAGVIVAWL